MYSRIPDRERARFPNKTKINWAYSSWVKKTMAKTIDWLWDYGIFTYNLQRSHSCLGRSLVALRMTETFKRVKKCIDEKNRRRIRCFVLPMGLFDRPLSFIFIIYRPLMCMQVREIRLFASLLWENVMKMKGK